MQHVLPGPLAADCVEASCVQQLFSIPKQQILFRNIVPTLDGVINSASAQIATALAFGLMSLLLLLSNMPMCSFHDRAIARKVETKGSTVVFHVDQGRSFLITFTTGFVYAASSIHEKIQSLHKVPHFLKGSGF